MSARHPGLPMAVITGGAVLAATLVASDVAVLILVLGRSDSTGTVIAAVAIGGAVSLGCAAAAAAMGHQFAQRLRALRAVPLRGPGDPPVELAAPGTIAAVELAELARTIEALTLRARVADEVADRHRRTAETTSAGMFELLSGLVAAEEGARGQLAAELHDTVAQSLALARSCLSAAQVDGESLQMAGEMAAEAEEQIRALMARTRPPALRDGDLAGAIAHLRSELNQRYALAVEVRWPTVPHPMPLVTAVTIYRFFQEALLNVVKHADVDAAIAELVVDDGVVVASVRDEGAGFDPAGVRSVKGRHVGLGLLGERSRLVGGSLEIHSEPGEGTTIQLRLPMAPGGESSALAAVTSHALATS